MKRMDIHQNQTTVAKKDPLPSCCRSIWNTFSHAAWPFKSSDGSHIEMRRHRPRSSPKPSMPVRFVFFAPGQAPVEPIKSYLVSRWSFLNPRCAPHGRKDSRWAFLLNCTEYAYSETKLHQSCKGSSHSLFSSEDFPLMCLILMPRHSYFHHGVFLQ